MSQHSSLKRKLKSYSAFAGAVLGVPVVASGQIVYTDIDPDISLVGNGAAVAIDMNGDAVQDFILAQFVSTFGGNLNFAGAAPYSNNGAEIIGYTSGPFYYPSALNAGDPIDAAQNAWGYFGYLGTLVWYYLDLSGEFGQWGDVTDKYMGVSFLDGGGDRHYGWIRMDVAKNPTNIVIKDLAFESTPDAGIAAGDVGAPADCDVYEPNNGQGDATSVTSGEDISAKITPDGDRDIFSISVSASEPNLRVSLTDVPMNYDVWVLNSSGKRVGKSNNTGSADDVVVVNDLPAGTYYAGIFQPKQKSDADNCYSLVLETSSTPFKLVAGTDALAQVKLFPNPANDQLVISWNSPDEAPATVSVLDLTGRVLLKQDAGTSGNLEMTLNVSSLAAGSYFAEIRTEGSTAVKKFNITR